MAIRSILGFASAARTASENSADLTNLFSNGAHIIIDMTAITAAGDVTFKLQGKDKISGKYYDILESPSITTVSTTVLKINTGFTFVGNLTANDKIPVIFRIVTTHVNAVSMTYSVGINLF